LFIQFSLIGLPGTKRAFLPLETYDFQEVFLSKTNSILTGHNVVFAPASSTDCFLSIDT
jgi:hypothetical protein